MPISLAYTGATAASCVETFCGPREILAGFPSVPARERTSLESLLLRDRWVIAGALVVVTALCWAWIVPMARDMYGPMDGSSAWMMTHTWDFTHLLLLFAMWAVMMIG